MVNKTVKDFVKVIPVSRETEEKLAQYYNILEKWSPKINLISKKTMSEAWQRHFIDSAQIIKLIPDKSLKIIDFGTGAGFPGMVLEIIKKDFNLDFKTYLIESDTKKCAFLQEVARVCELKEINIVNKRIETVDDLKVDVVTARALTSLNDLLKYSYAYITKSSKCIFLKTQHIESELKEAQKNWKFDYEIKPSVSNKDGLIIILKNIEPII